MTTRRASPGFTLAELIVGLTLSSMLLLAILSSYLFLGRNLTRLGINQELEKQSRRALSYLAFDLRMTRSVSSATSTALTLVRPEGTVTYNYSGGSLTRTASFGITPALVLFSNGQSFAFSYYTTGGGSPASQVTGQVVPLSVKQVDVAFSLAEGLRDSGTRTAFRAASARFILRNRLLPDGT